MENLNNEIVDPNTLQSPVAETPLEELKIERQTHKPWLKVILIIGGIVIFCGVAYGAFIYSSNPNLDLAPAELPAPKLSESSPSAQTAEESRSIATPRPTAQPTPTSVPKPSLQPTATPISFDLSTNNTTTTIRHYYNSGDGKGFVEQSPASYANNGPVFDELISLWSTQVELCTKIKTTQAVYGYNINFLPVLDNQEQTQQLVGSVTIPANQDYEVCSKLTNSTIGSHTFQIKFNPYRNFPELNYSNNLVEANYTILADNKAPTFAIYGPNSRPEGICFHVNDVTDNVSLFSEISFAYTFDNQSYTNLVEFACFASQDGNTHTVTIKATDQRGNSTENSRTFTAN